MGILCLNSSSKKKRSKWVESWVVNREKSSDMTLLRELRQNDLNDFFLISNQKHHTVTWRLEIETHRLVQVLVLPSGTCRLNGQGHSINSYRFQHVLSRHTNVN